MNWNILFQFKLQQHQQTTSRQNKLEQNVPVRQWTGTFCSSSFCHRSFRFNWHKTWQKVAKKRSGKVANRQWSNKQQQKAEIKRVLILNSNSCLQLVIGDVTNQFVWCQRVIGCIKWQIPQQRWEERLQANRQHCQKRNSIVNNGHWYFVKIITNHRTRRRKHQQQPMMVSSKRKKDIMESRNVAPCGLSIQFEIRSMLIGVWFRVVYTKENTMTSNPMP